MLTLDEMLNRQSSPPIPSGEPRRTSDSPCGPSPDAAAPSTVIGPVHTGKRPMEDFSQYAQSVARRKRLRPEDSDELVSYSKLSRGEKDIWLASTLLSIQGTVSQLQAPDAQWDLPVMLKKKIDIYSAVVILSPTLSAYVSDDAPRKVLIDILERYPSWGYKQDVKENPYRYNIVISFISAKLTARRYTAKKIIAESIGTTAEDPEELKRVDADDILALCEGLVAKVFKAAKIVITVPMCARVAFLRLIYVGQPDAGDKYWDSADEKLKDFRVKLSNDPKKISSKFAKILSQDRQVYGDVDVDYTLKSACMNAAQRMGEGVYAGTEGAPVNGAEQSDDDSG
ncbi:hypothetical protein GLOTRDRAFT_139378 [Gloeophyllum trabeum ATCC 11539]|uniref:Uncharacterized protein n=1 Tax=Gloeophyllum trabeum (strain ATCC 11539 / FP-39264 / Madison 617) TaxID=670483 RepID=S7Q306_GLOTA|nr:uncharacterized protein GLOTRDRAFT_139378 [Gloeophyllum trabeum ATCC 11539]EPQ53883.1 hypothetical protein GLOTRDRAFT_139378 [Gloeophyllum trabeum ATCC 11539]